MHMAAAIGVPTVAMFGPSDSRRNAPVFAGARFETLQDFHQPCAGTFDRTCRHHPNGGCMGTITPEQVILALNRVLGM
jgi:heptosyltransferase II